MRARRLIASELRRVLGGHDKYQQISFEPLQAELQTLECERALFVPEQLSRVIACGFGRTLASELEKMEARSWSESPTLICELSDVTILAREIFTSRERYFWGRSSPYRALSTKMQTIDHACLPNSLQGMVYFGHWLRDDCPTFELCRKMGRTVSLLRKPWPDCVAYEEAFDQTWNEVESAHANRLTIFREIGFNLSKGLRMEDLRGRLRRLNTSGSKCVFIRRGPSASDRSILNEAELISSLSAEGIKIVTPEVGGKNILNQCLDAKLIITVEGSQAAHAVYMLKRGGSLLILQPPDRFYNPHLEWTRLLGMHYGIVVGEQGLNGMTINPSEVLSMAEQLLRLS